MVFEENYGYETIIIFDSDGNMVDPADAESTADKFDLLLGDNLAGRKDYIANYGHLYIDMTDVS